MSARGAGADTLRPAKADHSFGIISGAEAASPESILRQTLPMNSALAGHRPRREEANGQAYRIIGRRPIVDREARFPCIGDGEVTE